MDNTPSSGATPPERSQSQHHHQQQPIQNQQKLSQMNGNGLRRPNTLSSPIDQRHLNTHQCHYTFTIYKDASGYGMKVSGDKPVYVDSVKEDGASQRAGLMANDMILKVDGVPVQNSTHTEVVQLIKASPIVKLTIQRNQQMQRPSSISMGPGTPVLPRGEITAPIPVDHATQRDLEDSKRQTLLLMLDQEQKNLENLKAASDSNSNRQKILKAESTIRVLQDQLIHVRSEDDTFQLIAQPQQHQITPVLVPTQSSHHHSTPPFLSRFPRSISSLSLGTKKKSVEKENVIASLNSPDGSGHLASAHAQYQAHHHQAAGGGAQQSTPKKKSSSSSSHDKNLKEKDIPPPLPQRNPPRKSLPTDGNHSNLLDDGVVLRRSGVGVAGDVMVSDLDHSIGSPTGAQYNRFIANNSPISSSSSSASGAASKSKKRSKTKIKALSDPKMSSKMFLEMECGGGGGGGGRFGSEPPPLPPRQPGMLEELNKSQAGKSGQPRPMPNSIETMMNYPLISTCTAVRDNKYNSTTTAFPLSNRPNIVQHLQQHQHLSHHKSTTSTAKNSTIFGGSHPTAQQQQQPLSSRHRRVVSSPDSLNTRGSSEFNDRMNKSASWDIVEKDLEEAPPGTPPPPYLYPPLAGSGGHLQHPHEDSVEMFDSPSSFGSNVSALGTEISAAQSNIAQKPIISMEDNDLSDQESFIDEDSPFKSLSRLLLPQNSVHLAVFLNYVLSNSDPAALLFYLITGLYREGSVKDMRKWAYEIHSTFLVPRAPLLWSTVEEYLAREVDEVLQNEYDKSEILRKIFWKSRIKAKDFINTQVQEFQCKRTAGLGTMYGPSDQQLAEAAGDKAKEQRIVEENLLPKLAHMIEENERDAPNECPKKLALASALSTVLHRMFITRTPPNSPIDKVHHFVSREKSFRTRIMGKKENKINVQEHILTLKQYYEVTHCNHCQNIIWGVSPQGYNCMTCDLNIHRSCSKVLEEICPGPPISKKGKDPLNDNNKIIRNFIGKIKSTNSNVSRRLEEIETGDDGLERTPASVIRQPSDRRPDSNGMVGSDSVCGTNNTSDMKISQAIDIDSSIQDTENDHRPSSKTKPHSTPVSVNRSGSVKERKSRRNERRKTSDPNLPLGPNDEPVDLGPSNANGTQSLHSSLSSSAESGDSDDDTTVEVHESDWSSNINADILRQLTDNEKRRQEIINEIYITERNHVRTLKLLDGKFNKPLREKSLLHPDEMQRLFPPALNILKDLHSTFETKLKDRRQEQTPLVNFIGDILIYMFDGFSGVELKMHAAHFCDHQQIALEALKEKRRKDEALHKFLTKQEAHHACRRLQLKDLLPTVLQRLTKYPLLFESLYKITLKVLPDNEKEILDVKKALDNSKQILDHVNQAVRLAEDSHKLRTIQSKLDKTNYEKEAAHEFKNLDLTEHKLVHDGTLIMKKHPNTQLHGLLFETMMVLLQKQDDRYILKYQQIHPAGDKSEIRFNPITKINILLVRQSAVDKNSFFLINTNVSQMLELTAPSNSECKAWFKHITDAAESYKAKTRGNNHDSVADSAQGPNTPADSFEATTSDQSQPPPSPIGATGGIVGGGHHHHHNHKIYHNIPGHGGEDGVSTAGSDVKDDDGNSCKNNNSIYMNRNVDDKGITDGRNAGGRGANDDVDDDDGEDDDEEDEVTDDDEDEGELGNRNSNETRMLTQQSRLVAPSEVTVNLNSAFTAEPVVTPSERLRRLDESIRLTLAEKQRIVCDMFRVPVEHFSAIADIAGQPEASEEPSDIVLSAFAQVQSITEILNEHIKVTTHQQISAVSTSLCDDCYRNTAATVKLETTSDGVAAASSCGRVPNTTYITTSSSRQLNVEEDENGYCEIDYTWSTAPPVGQTMLQTVNPTTTTGEQTPQPSTNISSNPTSSTSSSSSSSNGGADLKRQSTVSADSIPEETEHEMNALLPGQQQQQQQSDNVPPPPLPPPSRSQSGQITRTVSFNNKNANSPSSGASSTEVQNVGQSNSNSSSNSNNSNQPTTDVKNVEGESGESSGGSGAVEHDETIPNIFIPNESTSHFEINDAYDSTSLMSESNQDDESTLETQRLNEIRKELCGSNRLAHVESLVPSVPCHLIASYVTMLNEQITRLLPKLEERDVEREKLKRENQHLRELLNAKHEKDKVSESEETSSAINEQSPPPPLPSMTQPVTQQQSEESTPSVTE